MKGDVKVVVSGSSGHIVFDESSLIKRILLYLISAILSFGALFLAIMMDSRAYAATLPEIFMGTFEDVYTVRDPDEIAQMPETGDAMDHAIQRYMLDDDLGKHDDPKDAMYYPPVLLSDIDSSYILMLESKETGLPYDIIINSLGMYEDDIPMIGVILKERVVFVEISNSPINLSGKWFPEQKKVYEWVKCHCSELMSHWRRFISDKDLANMLTGESEQ